MSEAAKWYVVQTYSGYENTVKATLDKTIENRHLENAILEVIIPTETQTEVTDKGTKEYERKLFPGYILVKMVMTDENWYIVKNVRGVSGFVGAGNKPIPLDEEEVLKLNVETREVVVGFSVGDTVKISDGPFTGFTGKVDALDVNENSVRVIVSMFGRETPIELELDQVEVISD